MKLLKKPAFLIVVILFLIHQLIEKTDYYHFTFADNYFDPFACAIVILTIFLWEKRWIYQKGKHYVLSYFEQFVGILFIALVSEWVFPNISTDFTQDIRDVISIILGGIYFSIFINKT